MRLITLVLLALGLIPSLGAQPPRSAERDLRYRRLLDFGSLVKGGVVEPRWLDDGSSFWFVDRAADRTVILQVNPARNQVTPLLDTARVLQAKAATERDKVTPRLVRQAFPRTAPDVYEIPSPDGRWLLGEREHDLWLRSAVDGRSEPLTTDGVEDHEWVISDGRSSSGWSLARWSPDGLRIAGLKRDTRGMARLPLVHWLKTTEEVEWRPYGRTGGRIAQYRVQIVDRLSKRVIEVDTGSEPDQTLVVLGWQPNGSELLVLRLDRPNQRLTLLAADPATGRSREVHTEIQPTFIKGIAGNPGWLGIFSPLADGKRVLVTSERDGWDHLYLYGMDGKLVRRLTSGAWPVLRIVAVDLAREWVYFTAHAEPRIYDTQVYRVRLDGTGFRRLTEAPGQHAAVFSPSFEYFLDTHSSPTRPPAVDLRSADGRLIRTLAQANIDSLRALGWREPEEFVVKAADGTTDLHGILYQPFDFDSSRRYPVVEYIYGGPQLVNAPKVFAPAPGGASGLGGSQAMAQLGFVVVTVDARGTPERGKAFQDVVYRNFGRHEIPDHAAAIRQLAATRSYLDTTRVGIYGISWGGYMSIRAMVLAPELYKVAVPTFAVVDLWDHWADPIEPYMNVPQANREGYEYASSLRLADRIRGEMLIIAASSDVNATFSASMKLVEALTRAGKPYDLKLYLEQNHAFDGIYRDWHEATARYFEQRLRPVR